MKTGTLRQLVFTNLLLSAFTSGAYVNNDNGSTLTNTAEEILLLEILPTKPTLSAGQEAKISCRSVGPAANISWHLEKEQIFTSRIEKDSANGNESTSILRWTPSYEDNARKLTCRASYLNGSVSPLETSEYLDIHYAPRVVLRLGLELKPNDIEEGDDIYFDCKVRANPPATKVVWKHNDQIVTQNVRAGVVVSSEHLVLQRVTREQAGKYQCIASNDEGYGNSEAVNLQIKSNMSSSKQSKRSGLELAAVMKVGTHVVRGDDWSWGNQDGGPGHEGTVTSISPRGRVMVKWGDSDDEYLYRTGEDGIYELRLAPSELAQTEGKPTGYEISTSKQNITEALTRSLSPSSNELFGKLVERELDKIPEKNRLKLMEDILALFRAVNKSF